MSRTSARRRGVDRLLRRLRGRGHVSRRCDHPRRHRRNDHRDRGDRLARRRARRLRRSRPRSPPEVTLVARRSFGTAERADVAEPAELTANAPESLLAGDGSVAAAGGASRRRSRRRERGGELRELRLRSAGRRSARARRARGSAPRRSSVFRPASVSTALEPRRSVGHGRRSTRPARTRPSIRRVIPLGESCSFPARSLIRSDRLGGLREVDAAPRSRRGVRPCSACSSLSRMASRPVVVWIRARQARISGSVKPAGPRSRSYRNLPPPGILLASASITTDIVAIRNDCASQAPPRSSPWPPPSPRAYATLPAAGLVRARPEPLARVVHGPPPDGDQGPRPLPRHRRQARRSPRTRSSRRSRRPSTSPAVDSGDPKRDEHLRSADFFDAEKLPAPSRSARPRSRTTATASSRCTATSPQDVTQPVTLQGEYLGTQESPWGDTRVGFSAETEVSRKEWGLEWNVALETGGVLVGDKIKLTIDAEWVKE